MAYLAHSLVQLRSEINARWPHRDKASDGWLGDARHRREYSDHNPDGKGCVHAIDVDVSNVDRVGILNAAKRHPATHYIISNRRIYSREYGFRPRYYGGSNPHTKHIHISVSRTRSAEVSTRKWLSAGSTPTPKPGTPAYPGLLQRGSKGSAVKVLQTRLNARGYTPKLKLDGDFGASTGRNVRAFQKYARIGVDGKVGRVTWSKLWTLKVT